MRNKQQTKCPVEVSQHAIYENAETNIKHKSHAHHWDVGYTLRINDHIFVTLSKIKTSQYEYNICGFQSKLNAYGPSLYLAYHIFEKIFGLSAALSLNVHLDNPTAGV